MTGAADLGIHSHTRQPPRRRTERQQAWFLLAAEGYARGPSPEVRQRQSKNLRIQIRPPARPPLGGLFSLQFPRLTRSRQDSRGGSGLDHAGSTNDPSRQIPMHFPHVSLDLDLPAGSSGRSAARSGRGHGRIHTGTKFPREYRALAHFSRPTANFGADPARSTCGSRQIQHQIRIRRIHVYSDACTVEYYVLHRERHRGARGEHRRWRKRVDSTPWPEL